MKGRRGRLGDMAAKLTIHIYHEGGEQLAAAVRAAAPEREVVLFEEPRALAEGIAEVEVLFTSAPPRACFGGAYRLRLVQLMGAGADTLLPAPDLPPAVEVAGMGDLFAAETSEYVLAMMLAHCRALPTIVRRHDAREWRQFPCNKLSGQALGILGMGAVGRRVAALGQAFGMRVLAMRRHPVATEHVDEIFAPDQLMALLARVDFLAVVLPLTPATRGIVGQEALAQLPAHAMVINAGRGALLDLAALEHMLREGALGGAAVDVFDDEPLSAQASIWDAPNLVVTSHLAGYGRGYLGAAIEVLVDNLGRLEAGQSLRYRIDRKLGYRASV